MPCKKVKHFNLKHKFENLILIFLYIVLSAVLDSRGAGTFLVGAVAGIFFFNKNGFQELGARAEPFL